MWRSEDNLQELSCFLPWNLGIELGPSGLAVESLLTKPGCQCRALFCLIYLLDMVVHAFNSSTWEVESGYMIHIVSSRAAKTTVSPPPPYLFMYEYTYMHLGVTSVCMHGDQKMTSLCVLIGGESLLKAGALCL